MHSTLILAKAKVRLRNSQIASIKVQRSVAPLIERLTAGVVDDDISRRRTHSYPLDKNMKVCTEWWYMISAGAPECKVISVYTTDELYVGDIQFAKRLCGWGVKPELKTPTSNVCSIGYSKRMNSWWGWSHRGVSEFKVGDSTPFLNFTDTTEPEDNPQVIIRNLDEARQCAINYADYVG